MKWYKLSFSFFTAIFTIVFSFSLIVAILNFNIIKFVFAIFWLLPVWGLNLYLKRDGKFAFETSFGFVAVLWSFFAFLEYKRVVFVIENGGMERADGYGSPLAFLINLFFESILFLPLNISLILGIYVLIKKIITKSGKAKS